MGLSKINFHCTEKSADVELIDPSQRSGDLDLSFGLTGKSFCAHRQDLLHIGREHEVFKREFRLEIVILVQG